MDEQYGKLIEPAPVAFTFGAPGWYVLGILALSILLIISWLLFRFYKNNLYRKEAIKLIEQKEQELRKQPILLVYETNMLMKRVAMRKYGRDKIAAVRNKEWTELLNHTMKQQLFDNSDQLLLQQTIYSNDSQSNTDSTKFTSKAKTWIRKHRQYAF